MDVLSALKKLKTSTDFADALGTLEVEHAEATAAVGELESQREDLIFNGGDLAALEAKISTAEGRAKTLAITLDGAKRRRAEAAEGEARAVHEKTAAGAVEKKKALRAELIDFHKLAVALAIHAGEITRLREEIEAANKITLNAGHDDLRVRDPIFDIGKSLGHRVRDPLRDMVVQGYWPPDRHVLPSGKINVKDHQPPLAMLKK